MAAAQEKRQLNDLMDRKKQIEEDIKELKDVLESQSGVGMEGSLVDADQFPRNDIDVYSVRQARHRIICLQNDHKELMKQIEEGLHYVHAAAREQGEQRSRGQPMNSQETDAHSKSPFAIVERVDAGSPAENSGLMANDEIVQFGSINRGNFQNLQNIVSVVQHSRGKPVSVLVMRGVGKEEVHLGLIPNTWSGPGLLGCKIVPR
ncbi:hypothetical protein CAPTEDRAFT_171080 [Capitella teleta]|uniref:26S proteasome non-ATPase regulatory subunit 9 n=1 Tax=Capitella teleta TaxID=283909 RepID=R7TG79_CAPTE|nr:hypothetical protein CAPTEDRAFT_171080 [Capitella teleta]|eukprot:ELT92719.1 hypothetical protein CAPTEDRAFT_171080 [Capitella teleta]